MSGMVPEERITDAGEPAGFAKRVMTAVLWRSGSQFAAQMVMWTATFFVIRLLQPSDYGLFAMTQSILVLLNLLCGYGFASSLIQAKEIDDRKVRQVFGLLIMLNGSIALAQVLLAPLAAAYFRQPMVTHMLRVQALIYISTPFIALPSALLARRMDFRREAQVNFAGAIAGALTALTCALAGAGVWTLVMAPIALFWTRAIGMTIAARALVWPSFRFAGMGGTWMFGGAMILSQFLWFVQTQADVAIGGRALAPHELGLYTTALFLSQIVTSKFIPPLNDVAFSAYARIQNDRAAVAYGFGKAARIVMLIAAPFCLGLAATAEPLILTVLGEKWAEAVPLVRIVALAMPALAMQILFSPAATALGQPGVQVRVSACGAVIMPVAFIVGIHAIGGGIGLASAWAWGTPLLMLATAWLAMPVIGVTAKAMVRAALPGLGSGIVMALAVLGVDQLIDMRSPALRLAVLVVVGGAVYCGLVMTFARTTVLEAMRLLLRR
ncbi:O-antigen/teichoic acid export membrane protein [Sphingomonas prati]|uniref:O-antigen/teichoic acid export membrane protein n=2 Tax=Sphingomonas prati TaxID=1843237 RepID=A0A7W9BQ80_9SPHN|nr:O-antigen/teichoic acid export membrane protein [Sphingomonas prati]